MSSKESLRQELEAVYKRHVEALRNKDFDAFAATTAVDLEQLGVEQIAQFAEVAESLSDITFDLSQTTFVAVKEEGSLAGYYHIFRDPTYVTVILTAFRKVNGQWKIIPSSQAYSFQPTPGEDIIAKAKQLMETEHSLSLELVGAAETGPAASAWDESLQAVFECSAYGYDVQITINGARLDFDGGHSYSCWLYGCVQGTQPVILGVLQAGENQITIEYHKTGEQEISRLTVNIFVPPDKPLFQLITAERQNGKVTATFTVPAAVTDEAPFVMINDDEALR